MKLTPEDIEEFRRIWKEEFGEEIGFDEAEAIAQNLLNLILEILRKKPPKSNP